MSIMSIVSMFAFMIYTYMGLQVLFLNIKSKTHWYFALTCFSLSLWAFSPIFFQSAPDEKSYLFWLVIGSLGYMYVSTLILQFFISLTTKKFPLIYRLILYIPSIVLFAVNLFNNFIFTNLVFKDGIWFREYNFHSPFLIIFFLHIFLSG